jgi:hypothetical protein
MSVPSEDAVGRSESVGYGVGYARLSEPGAIETLHALDPDIGRTLCGRSVAISWSAEHATATQIDCRPCEEAIERRQGACRCAR